MKSPFSSRALERTDAAPVIRFGMLSLGIAFGVFLLWSAFAPIASSLVVQGTLISDGRNKILQHPLGGRVAAIHVSDGMHVTEGEAIVTLDPAQSRAELTRLRARRSLLLASRRRLHSELGIVDSEPATWLSDSAFRGAAGIDPLTTSSIGLEAFDAATDADQAAARAIGESEKGVYRSGREALAKEIAALDAKIETLRRTRQGTVARLEAARRLADMSAREVRRLRPLANDGYVARNRLMDRERALLERESRASELEQEAAAVTTSIREVEHERARVRAADRNVSARQLTKITAELAELSDQIVAARAAVAQTVLRAPTSGTVVALVTGTVGGVVSAGESVAEIVPAAADMRIEARVAPRDIARIAVGQSARLAVTAFAWRGDDPVPARVVHIAADATRDEETGETYFPVRLAPEASDPAGRRAIAGWGAGMRADVYVHTGDRTFLSYLFEPLTRSFRRSFREG